MTFNVADIQGLWQGRMSIQVGTSSISFTTNLSFIYSIYITRREIVYFGSQDDYVRLSGAIE